MSKLADNKTDFWVQDCAAATQNILLTAEHLGLGTCWCGVYPKEPATKQVKEILNLEEGIIPLSLIQLGYKDEEKEARTQYAKERVVEIK
jgi:nitroreductase